MSRTHELDWHARNAFSRELLGALHVKAPFTEAIIIQGVALQSRPDFSINEA